MMRMVGLLGLSQTLDSHVLFAIDIGGFRPGIESKELVDGRIEPRNIRIRLLHVDDSRIFV